MDGDPRFRCNICGDRADFVVQLELVKQKRLYDALRLQKDATKHRHEKLFSRDYKGKPVDD
jgi:hypothetical protein